jgi:hypothetical protein
LEATAACPAYGAGEPRRLDVGASARFGWLVGIVSSKRGVWELTDLVSRLSDEARQGQIAISQM